MPDVKTSFYRGASAGIDNTPLVDGQILFDREAKRIFLDITLDNVVTRIAMKEGTFTGTAAEWNALTDAQKEVFTFVNITDDYELHSDVFVGATASTDGQVGLVPAPEAGDEGKYLKGDGTWGTVADPSDMTGADGTNPGTHGLVPAPAATDNTKYLKGDGTWGDPSITVDDALSTTSENPVQNKIIRSAFPFNLGVESGVYGYYKANGDFVDFKSQADIDSAVAAAKVGTATDAQVLTGYTFTNSTTSGVNGAMTNNGAVSQSLNTSTTSYTIPEGYHNGSGTVSLTTQTKSASSSTSAQTITPDSGKVLSSVSISAITPQRTAGTAAVASGQDSTGPYVYFPYGWWPSGGNDRQYCRMTAAQAVAACPSQEKTVTSSRSNQTVTPDSGKLLSKVTVSGLAPTGTYTASSRGASLDMGATSNYRYVNTNSVPNSNSGTKTISSSDTNWYTGNVDMGATNTYRYVNAVNVYNKGKEDGASVFVLYFNIYSAHFRVGYLNTNTKTMSLSAITAYNSSVTLSGLTVTMDAYGSGDNISRLQTNKACSFQSIANGSGSEIKISIPANTKTSLTGAVGGWFGVLTM